jgi:hypothetical protein
LSVISRQGVRHVDLVLAGVAVCTYPSADLGLPEGGALDVAKAVAHPAEVWIPALRLDLTAHLDRNSKPGMALLCLGLSGVSARR